MNLKTEFHSSFLALTQTCWQIHYNYNYYNGTYSSGYGSSPNANFTADNQLNSATLKGTFTLYDYQSQTTETAQVDLTWMGVGDKSSGKYSYTYQAPTSLSRYRSIGESRDAQVSGSVTLDGTNIIANLSSDGAL